MTFSWINLTHPHSPAFRPKLLSIKMDEEEENLNILNLKMRKIDLLCLLIH